MTFPERVQQELTAAMKAKDELRLSVLRMMKTALKNKQVEKIKPLDDAESIQVLRTMIKQRQEAIEQYERGGRPELAEKEKKEVVIIEGYLPARVSEEEIEATVRATIAELGAKTMKDMGPVMKAVMAKFSGKVVDGKTVSDRVRAALSGSQESVEK